MMPVTEQSASRALYAIARPGGSVPVPAAMDEAEALFSRASAAYARGDFRQAAIGFLAAADRMRLEQGRPYWETFAANRVAAYKNADSSFRASGALSEERSTFNELVGTDPHCAAELRALVAALPSNAQR